MGGSRSRTSILLFPGSTWTDGDDGADVVHGRWLMQQVSRYRTGTSELIVAESTVMFRLFAAPFPASFSPTCEEAEPR